MQWRRSLKENICRKKAGEQLFVHGVAGIYRLTDEYIPFLFYRTLIPPLPLKKFRIS